MANIIIHLSKENVQDLIKNRDIIVGSDKKEVRLSVTVPPNSPKGSVFDLFRENISRLKQNGCLRTAETYTATFNKLRRFCNNKDLAPSDITPELMGSFETWLRNQQLAKIDQKLTMYVARHSWASIAREMGIPLNVISHGMGHSDEKTP